MKPLIRQGDTLSEHGGRVLDGHYLCDDRPIACEGDAAWYNLHGSISIAEGNGWVQLDDKPVALDGHACTCGCTLVSSMIDTQVAS